MNATTYDFISSAIRLAMSNNPCGSILVFIAKMVSKIQEK